MAELFKELIDVLPENDLYRTIILIAAVIILPIKPAIWIGQAIRYSVRWIRCKIFGSHSWVAISGAKNVWGQPMSGTAQCRVCLKLMHF